MGYKVQSLLQIIAQESPYPHYYGLADGAMNHYIYAHLQAYEIPRVALLDREDLPPEQRVWLFKLRTDHLFSQWYLPESQGKYWGVILGSPLALSEIYCTFSPSKMRQGVCTGYGLMIQGSHGLTYRH